MKFIFLLATSLSVSAQAAAPVSDKRELSQKLFGVRNQILNVEKEIVDASKVRDASQIQLKKLQSLIVLQKQERSLIQQRMHALEGTTAELNQRKSELEEKVSEHRKRVRKFMANLHSLEREMPKTARPVEEEVMQAPLRKTYSNLVNLGFKEIEILKVDLADAQMLEQRIQEEKDHLAYLLEELREQESVLEMNRQMHAELLKKRSSERMVQFENYRKLKSVELQVEQMMQQLNARKELQDTVEAERKTARAYMPRPVAQRFPFPVRGKIVSNFGKNYDPRSRLVVFKKGIDIAAASRDAVRAVSDGRVAFSGELPHYGKVTILDHGNHLYSLAANLGSLNKQTGESVKAGDPIGQVDDGGTPVYFEIRSHNVAVNPLQWLTP